MSEEVVQMSVVKARTRRRLGPNKTRDELKYRTKQIISISLMESCGLWVLLRLVLQ